MRHITCVYYRIYLPLNAMSLVKVPVNNILQEENIYICIYIYIVRAFDTYFISISDSYHFNFLFMFLSDILLPRFQWQKNTVEPKGYNHEYSMRMCHVTVIFDIIMNIKLWRREGKLYDALLRSLSWDGLISRGKEYMPCHWAMSPFRYADHRHGI